jgi:hypothetical protein
MSAITKRTALALAMILAWSVTAQAQGRRGVVVVPHGPFVGVSFYNPFWGPYYLYAGYPYAGYPYGPYLQAVPFTTDIKVQVTPKQADVYVDGYLAGVVGDLGGVLKRLHATPGGHVITVYLEGDRTISKNVYLAPGSTYTLHEAMEKLAPGEVSAPVPAPLHQK